jgi:hypothetical protein
MAHWLIMACPPLVGLSRCTPCTDNDPSLLKQAFARSALSSAVFLDKPTPHTITQKITNQQKSDRPERPGSMHRPRMQSPSRSRMKPNWGTTTISTLGLKEAFPLPHNHKHRMGLD